MGETVMNPWEQYQRAAQPEAMQQEAMPWEQYASFMPPMQPIEPPIAQGDWSALAQRLDTAQGMMPSGMNRESAMAEQGQRNRMDEAVRQGQMYGANGASGGRWDTFDRSARNTLGLGLPQLYEAYAPSMLGGQSSIPGAEAHEFIKAADKARADKNYWSSLGGKGVGIIGQAVATAPITAATLPLRIAQGIGLGGAMGGAESAIESRGDLEKTAEGAGWGALFGGIGAGVGEGVSKGAQKVGGMFSKPVPVPTREELSSAAQQAYQRAEQSGAMYSNDALKQAKAMLETKFADRGFAPELQPSAYVALRKVQEAADAGLPITLKGVDTLRKTANAAYLPGNKSNNALSAEVVRTLDDLVGNPANAIGGDTRQAAAALQEARDMYSRSAKQELIDNLLERAGIRTDRAGSGGNIDNATRQEISKLLTDKNMRGFTGDEKTAIRQVIAGTPVQNALRLAGKLSPSGSGLMTALQAGTFGATGGASTPLLLGGMGAKFLADRATARNVEELGRLVRAGGSKAAITPPDNAMQRLAKDKRLPLISTLLGYQLSASGRDNQ